MSNALKGTHRIFLWVGFAVAYIAAIVLMPSSSSVTAWEGFGIIACYLSGIFMGAIIS